MAQPAATGSVTNVLALAAFTFGLAAGQVLFKRAGLAIQGVPLANAFVVLLRQPSFYAAGALYAAATALWIWILSRIPLTQAYPWVAVGMIIVPLAGRYWFGERVGAFFWPGALLVMLGLILTQIGSPSP